MINLKGKYSEAKIFTDVVDEESIKQVNILLDQPFVEGSKIRMMPDIHAGAGCTIGTTMTIHNKICPNLVGVDIGCGMEVVRIKERYFDPHKLDVVIRDNIPSGFNIRKENHENTNWIDLVRLKCFRHIDLDRALNSIGTLGGGNHFIEANKDDEGNIYIVVHSGSRHLGLEIANYYQEQAYKSITTVSPEEIKSIVAEMKANGQEKDIQTKLKEIKSKLPNIPKALAYVEGELLSDYLNDMFVAQEYANLNRFTISQIICHKMGFHEAERFTTIHNYIDTKNGILRKGAVSAQKGERLIIPINMRDGSLICVGKGNEDWNCSAPHGAGRLMSRSKAKESFTVSEFKKQMEGIYTTSVDKSTLDECPMAYKSMEDIVNNISDTVTIEKVIKPIYNFKAGDNE